MISLHSELEKCLLKTFVMFWGVKMHWRNELTAFMSDVSITFIFRDCPWDIFWVSMIVHEKLFEGSWIFMRLFNRKCLRKFDQESLILPRWALLATRWPHSDGYISQSLKILRHYDFLPENRNCLSWNFQDFHCWFKWIR